MATCYKGVSAATQYVIDELSKRTTTIVYDEAMIHGCVTEAHVRKMREELRGHLSSGYDLAVLTRACPLWYITIKHFNEDGGDWTIGLDNAEHLLDHGYEASFVLNAIRRHLILELRPSDTE